MSCQQNNLEERSANGWLLPISSGLHVRLDPEDYEWASRYRWTAKFTAGLVYAARNAWLGNGKRKWVMIHNLVLPPEPGTEVDHINRDPLDNRRANLRLATRCQNIANRAGWGASGFKGVFAAGGRWDARIRLDGRLTYLGSFATKDEAARAYDARAHAHYGAFALLNFPLEYAR